jgi:hypothetical protein
MYHVWEANVPVGGGLKLTSEYEQTQKQQKLLTKYKWNSGNWKVLMYGSKHLNTYTVTSCAFL